LTQNAVKATILFLIEKIKQNPQHHQKAGFLSKNQLLLKAQ
jgi:hypothetical protein